MTEPLAIIGIGCLFPKADSVGAYWANIKNGVDGIGPIPATHWDPADYFDADPKRPDFTYAQRGGFLDPYPFNPVEWGIAPNDIEATDTSQLLALVVAQMALRDAGVAVARVPSPATKHNPATNNGQKTVDANRVSVILGVTGTLEMVVPLGARLGHPIWRKALMDSGVDDEVAEDVIQRIGERYVGWQENSFPGLLGNVVAGRVANRLDLGGTNCVVDAACASSLSALHLAGMELQTGRADVVVTGGVDTFNDIFMYMCFSKTPALSPSGDAKPFDANGDGTILGEGLGIVVLRRLADAERDGNRIYAVIKGVGTSSDGKGNAIYAPSSAGQVEALRAAYRQANVTPDTIELIEAHGTGTRVGDAAEVQALTQVFGETPSKRLPWCALGSVKSQIGHTKAAAGAAGLIKAALALHHKVLPPTIKVKQPLEALASGATPFYVNTEPRPWLPSDRHPRRAAVSAFGFGGSNFHCVLEEHRSEKQKPDWDGDTQIVALSADSQGELTSRLNQWITRTQAATWAEIRALAAESRSNFNAAQPQRLVFVMTRGGKDIAARARQLLEANAVQPTWHDSDGIAFGSGPRNGDLGFLFPGQGSQAVGMLRDLACTFPAMQQTLADADRAYASAPANSPDKRLSDFIFPPPAFNSAARAEQEAALRATSIAQPALGAVSLGTLRVLAEFGVRPQATAGHSYGELTALCAAGCYDAASLFELSQLRGRLMADRGADAGAMLAVQAPLGTVEGLLKQNDLDLVIANRNAPNQAVLSGRTSEIERATQALNDRKVRHVRLPVAAAFHSSLVAAAADPFRAALEPIEFQSARLPVYANSTGREYPHDPRQVRDLLACQLARPVEFVGQIRNMSAAGVRTFLEVGPGSTLTKLVESILEGQPHQAIALDASAGKRSGLVDLAVTLSRLAALGHSVRLSAWDEGAPPVEAKPDRPTMTIPICGANYRKPTPSRPARKATTPSQPARTQPETDAPMANDSLNQALKVTQDSLAAFQRMQEQTAQLHRQFLETQESAQKTLQSLVEGQQRLLSASMGLPVGPLPIAPVAPMPQVSPPPRTIAPTPKPAPVQRQPEPVPVTPPVVPSRLSPERVERVLLSVVAEKTGYPPEMINPDMGLDADLGIDSIKRVEILSALQEQLPEAPAVKPEHLGTLQTLRQIVEFLCSSNQSAIEQPAPAKQVEPQPIVSTGLRRLVVGPAELHGEARSPSVLKAGASICLVGNKEPLTAKIEERLTRRGFEVTTKTWDESPANLPAEFGALVLVAPDDGESVALRAFRWIKAARAAMIVTATRIDGKFGFSDRNSIGRPEDGALAGIVKTAGREWSEVSVKAIDVDPALEPTIAADAIVDEVLLDGPVEVGITANGRFKLQLSDASFPAGHATHQFTPNDVVVLTGGARGVTAETAVAIANSGRPAIVLLGRSPEPVAESSDVSSCSDEVAIKRVLATKAPSASPRQLDDMAKGILAGREIRRTLDRIAATGARAQYRSVDIRDARAVSNVLADVRRDCGPITGLVHGAGVLADRKIADQTETQFESVYSTKVDGLKSLLSATATDPVKLLALFSSSTGRFGRIGQVAYAAANEALNKIAQAESRRRPECRVVSVNWGPWDGGMVTPALRGVFSAEGIGLIPLADGACHLLGELAAADRAVETVVLGAGSKIPERAAPAPKLSDRSSTTPGFDRELDLERHPILRAHVIDGRAVLPMALTIEWLAHAALHGNPGLAFVGLDDLRIFQPVTVHQGKATPIRIHAEKAQRRDGLHLVTAEIRSHRADGKEVVHSRGTVLLGASVQAPPASSLIPVLPPYALDTDDVYQRILFHGPELRGIEQITGCGSDGIVVTSATAPAPSAWIQQPLRSAWLADPLALDCAFQAMSIWCRAERGAVSLPSAIPQYRQFVRRFPGEWVRIVCRVKPGTGQVVRADIEFLDEHGKLVASIDSYECVLDPALNAAFRRNRLERTTV